MSFIILTLFSAFFPAIDELEEIVHVPDEHKEHVDNTNGCRCKINRLGVFFETIRFATKKLYE